MCQRLLCLSLLIATLTAPAAADKPSLLKMFSRRPAASADQSQSYNLTAEDGPWLILASTMVGDGSRRRAERLASEIRRDLGLPAFIYQEKFDFTGNLKTNTPSAKRLRYANPYQYEACSVLVGEYDSVEHPNIEKNLRQIRTAVPDVYRDANEVEAETNRSNPVTTVKSIASRFVDFQSNKKRKAGPMSSAFVTRNPLLPDEYFESPQVDSFVHQLNDGKEFSLLACKGNFTVVVKTFEAYGRILDNKTLQQAEPDGGKLDDYIAHADKMVKALRKQGVEAYQFHDRFRSLVTVGSFHDLGRELPDGRFEYTPEIRTAMKRYSALNVRPELARQVPRGTRGFAANSVANTPFDVQPKPIAVPKRSKRSLYSAALGMK